MKRFYVSLGLVAASLASVQNGQGQSVDTSKAWSVSASLRGFYDDNVNTTPTDKLESFGLEVSPTVSFSLKPELTEIGASYTYGYKWYDKSISAAGDHDDQTHTFAALLRHSFSERMALAVQDSFVIGQEPDALRIANSAAATFQRIPGDNIRNYGSIIFSGQVTREFGIELGYANTLFDYQDKGEGVFASSYAVTNGTIITQTDQAAIVASRSGLLDRLEHSPHIDLRWLVLPQTTVLVGYQFSDVNYTGDELVSGNYLLQTATDISTAPPAVAVITNRVSQVFESKSRNSRSHYGYAGIEHTFTPDLTANLRAGARFTDYYESPDKETSVSPYVMGSLRWRYTKESFIELGVSHDISATDQFSADGGSFTRDSDATVAYLSLRHRLAPNLFGSVMGSFQNSTYNGGAFDEKSDQYYTAGVNLEYYFNRNFSAELGYNYDRLDSGTTRGDYDRDRVYVGARFTY